MMIEHQEAEILAQKVNPNPNPNMKIGLGAYVYCTSFQSSGFKGLLHVPVSQPEMVEFGFAMSPGTENFYSIKPHSIHAQGALKKVWPEKQQCFLEVGFEPNFS